MISFQLGNTKRYTVRDCGPLWSRQIDRSIDRWIVLRFISYANQLIADLSICSLSTRHTTVYQYQFECKFKWWHPLCGILMAWSKMSSCNVSGINEIHLRTTERRIQSQSKRKKSKRSAVSKLKRSVAVLVTVSLNGTLPINVIISSKSCWQQRELAR